jgi:ribosomal protein L11 methyltransferase
MAVPSAWPAMPDRLWRASFTVPGDTPPDRLGALEERALSVALFAIEDEARAEPVAWRVDLFLAEEPDAADLARELAPLVPGADLAAIEVEPVPPEDWVAASAMQQEPVRVGRFFVHAAKDRGLAPPDAVALEVEAGLAFGSGEHATTQACLEAIDRLARTRRCRRVLDLGCGSGILAMAAARAWPAARVVAADNDPVAVRVAAENVALNRLAGRVRLVVADGFRHGLIRRAAPFDLVLANILADPLVELAPALARHLAPGGTAVLSGLLDRQAEAVAAAHAAQGLRPAGRIDKGPWVGLTFRKPARRRAESHRPESAPR